MSNDKRVERDGTDFPLTPKWDESMNFTKDDLSAAREAWAFAGSAYSPDAEWADRPHEHIAHLKATLADYIRSLKATHGELDQLREHIRSLEATLAQRNARVARLTRCPGSCGDLARTDKGDGPIHKHSCPRRNRCQTHPDGCPDETADLRAQLAQRDEEMARLRGRLARRCEDVARLRGLHYPDGDECGHDKYRWPCPTIAILDAGVSDD